MPPPYATAHSLTIGQAAALTRLHKNTIRAYIKQGRLAAVPVRGKYGQEYRIGRAAVMALSALVNPLAEGAGAGVVGQAVPTPHEQNDGAVGVVNGAEAVPHEGLAADVTTEQPQAVPGTASAPNLSLEPLAALIRHLQEENRNLAGQLGFVQAQLQQAHETIRMLQAPPPEPENGDETVVDAVATITESPPAPARPWWKFW